MKRCVVSIVFICGMFFVSSHAHAEFRPTEIKESCYMKINAYSDNSRKYRDGKNWSYKDKGYDNSTIYVRHYIPHNVTPYTNHFRVREVDKEGNTLSIYGDKWCTPGLNVPIQSDEIGMNNYYSVTARGNTCHYQYDNVDRVELRVNMYVNMNTYPKEKEMTSDDDLDHGIFD